MISKATHRWMYVYTIYGCLPEKSWEDVNNFLWKSCYFHGLPNCGLNLNTIPPNSFSRYHNRTAWTKRARDPSMASDSNVEFFCPTTFRTKCDTAGYSNLIEICNHRPNCSTLQQNKMVIRTCEKPPVSWPLYQVGLFDPWWNLVISISISIYIPTFIYIRA